MKMAFYAPVLALLLSSSASAQGIKISPGGDTTRTVTLEGYADAYFGFDFSEPSDGTRPYFVSHSRHNETNINLAYLSLKYSSARARAAFTPGFGTYVNANYAAERQTLQNLLEANIGVRPFKNRQIWLDAGVFNSPYTTETAVAHDQLLYTRSLAAEYSPYYLTGLRATLPLSRTVALYLYLVNGWQVIQNTNAPLSYGSALEWKPADKVTLVWSTYIGNERSASQPQYRGRYFSDLYAVYNPNSRLSLSADVYAGRQRLDDSTTRKTPVSWYQGNVNARYFLTASQSIGARVEYFHDAHAVLVVPAGGGDRFDCASASLGYNVAITDHVVFHLEGRYFSSGHDVFYDRAGMPTTTSAFAVGGLTAKF